MRKVMIAVLSAALMGGAVWAQGVANPEIQGTIQRQIDAFLADDVATAFGFASAPLQRLFGSAENFGRMVKQGYPMVWRPDDVRFGPLQEGEGDLRQQVIVRDGQGATHVLEYRMLMQDGEWRIGGVRILPQPDVSA